MAYEKSILMRSKIGIIGLGNIGYSLAKGLLLNESKISVFAYDHNSFNHNRAKSDIDNLILKGNVAEVINTSIIIFICIRTNQIADFLKTNINSINKDKIIVFLSAGIKMTEIKVMLNDVSGCYFRAITNVNTISKNGYTLLLKNGSQKEEKMVSEVLKMVGEVDTVETEDKLDILSLATGCTPAIIALFYESLVESCISLGISKIQAKDLLKRIINQTIGTINDNNMNSRELIQSVCTPGGLVVKHLAELENETDFKEDIVNWLPKILRNLPN